MTTHWSRNAEQQISMIPVIDTLRLYDYSFIKNYKYTMIVLRLLFTYHINYVFMYGSL